MVSLLTNVNQFCDKMRTVINTALEESQLMDIEQTVVKLFANDATALIDTLEKSMPTADVSLAEQYALSDDIHALRHQCEQLHAANVEMKRQVTLEEDRVKELVGKLNLRDNVLTELKRHTLREGAHLVAAGGANFAAAPFEFLEAVEVESAKHAQRCDETVETNNRRHEASVMRQQAHYDRIILAKEQEIVQLQLQFRNTLAGMQGTHESNVLKLQKENEKLQKALAEASVVALQKAEERFQKRLERELGEVTEKWRMKVKEITEELAVQRAKADGLAARLEEVEADRNAFSLRCVALQKALNHAMNVELPEMLDQVRAEADSRYSSVAADRTQLQDEMNAARDKIEDLEARLGALDREHTSMKNSLQKEITTWQQKNNKLEAQLRDLQNTKVKLEHDLAELKLENQELKVEMAELRKLSTEAIEEEWSRKLRDARAEFEYRTKELEKELEALREEREAAEEQIKTLIGKIEDHEEALRAMDRDLLAAKLDKSQAEKELQKAHDALHLQTRTNSELASQIHKLQTKVVDAETAAKAMESEVGTLTELLGDARKENQALQNEISTLDEDAATLRERIAELEAKLAAASAENQQLHQQQQRPTPLQIPPSPRTEEIRTPGSRRNSLTRKGSAGTPGGVAVVSLGAGGGDRTPGRGSNSGTLSLEPTGRRGTRGRRGSTQRQMTPVSRSESVSPSNVGGPSPEISHHTDLDDVLGGTVSALVRTASDTAEVESATARSTPVVECGVQCSLLTDTTSAAPTPLSARSRTPADPRSEVDTPLHRGPISVTPPLDAAALRAGSPLGSPARSPQHGAQSTTPALRPASASPPRVLYADDEERVANATLRVALTEIRLQLASALIVGSRAAGGSGELPQMPWNEEHLLELSAVPQQATLQAIRAQNDAMVDEMRRRHALLLDTGHSHEASTGVLFTSGSTSRAGSDIDQATEAAYYEAFRRAMSSAAQRPRSARSDARAWSPRTEQTTPTLRVPINATMPPPAGTTENLRAVITMGAGFFPIPRDVDPPQQSPRRTPRAPHVPNRGTDVGKTTVDPTGYFNVRSRIRNQQRVLSAEPDGAKWGESRAQPSISRHPRKAFSGRVEGGRAAYAPSPRPTSSGAARVADPDADRTAFVDEADDDVEIIQPDNRPQSAANLAVASYAGIPASTPIPAAPTPMAFTEVMGQRRADAAEEVRLQKKRVTRPGSAPGTRRPRLVESAVSH